MCEPVVLIWCKKESAELTLHSLFLEAVLHCTYTDFASARPESAKKIIKKRRAMLAPTLLNFVPTKVQQAERASPFPTRVRRSYVRRREFSTVPAGSDGCTVSANVSTPGFRNHRIRDCVNSPLKARSRRPRWWAERRRWSRPRCRVRPFGGSRTLSRIFARQRRR